MQTFQLLFAKRAPATGTAATARKPGDGGDNDDIMIGQGTQEQRADSVDRLIESHDNM